MAIGKFAYIYANLNRLCMPAIVLVICLLAFSTCTNYNSSDKTVSFSQDTAAVNSLIDTAAELSGIQPESSLKYLHQAYSKAEKAAYPKGSMEALARIRKYYQQKGSSDTALVFARKAYNMALQHGNKTDQCERLIETAGVHYDAAMYDSALAILDDAALKNEAEKDEQLQAKYSNLAGYVYSSLGRPKEALTANLIAASIYEKQKNDASLAIIYNNLGLVFRSLNRADTAIKYYQKAAGVNRKLNNLYALAMNYGNLGVMYQEEDSAKAAIFYFRESSVYARETGSSQLLASNFLNIGNAFKQQRNYTTALMYYDSAQYVCQSNHIDYGLLLIKMNRSDLYAQQGNFALAERNLMEALASTRQMKLIDEENNTLWMISEMYSAHGNFKLALEYSEKFHSMKDSLQKINNNKSINELLIKSEKEQHEKEVQLLNSTIKSTRQSRTIILVTTLLTILILAFLVISYVAVNRKIKFEKILAEKEKEKLSLIRELSDQELATKNLQIEHTSETINHILNYLLQMQTQASGEMQQSISVLINDLKKESNLTPQLEFITHFEKVHQSFYSTLSNNYPQLSASEIKLCGYLRMNLTTKEIASLTNRSIRTIETHRYNIRTKLGITSDTGLSKFLISI